MFIKLLSLQRKLNKQKIRIFMKNVDFCNKNKKEDKTKKIYVCSVSKFSFKLGDCVHARKNIDSHIVFFLLLLL